MSKNNFCYECGSNAGFTETTISETVKVKDLEIQNSHLYYRCNGCGELYEPFNDPDQNILSDYRIYREKKNFYQPEELLEIRKKYKLSQRELSQLFGMSYSTISNIENGALQNTQQNALYAMADSPEAMCELLKRNKDLFEKERVEELFDNALTTCSDEYKEMSDKMSHITRTMNNMRYELAKFQYEIGGNQNKVDENQATSSNRGRGVELSWNWIKKTLFT